MTANPRKRAFPAATRTLFRGLAKLKGLRGTWFDPFGHTAERRAERQLLRDYEAMLGRVTECVTTGTYDTAVALASLPQEIRGFGHVKQRAIEEATVRREELMRRLGIRLLPAVQIVDAAA